MNRTAMFAIASRASKRVLGGIHQLVCSTLVLAMETGALRGVPEAQWEETLAAALRCSLSSIKAAFPSGHEVSALIPLLVVDLRTEVDSIHRAKLDAEHAAAAAFHDAADAERAKVAQDQASYQRGGESYDAGEECPADADEWFALGWSDRQTAVDDARRLVERLKAEEEEARLEAEAAAMRAEADGSAAAPLPAKPANHSMPSKGSRPKAQG